MATATFAFPTRTPCAPPSTVMPSRSRTTSLFSSVSNTLFGTRSKGKEKVVTVDSAQPSAPTKSLTRNKSLLARRLSQPTSKRPRKVSKTTPVAETRPLGELNGLASYVERSATFSRSSPELGDANSYQAWPHFVNRSDNEESALSSSPLPMSPESGLFPRSARADYDIPSMPRERTLSYSPTDACLSPADLEARRALSRAEALAKLTDSATSLHSAFPTEQRTSPRPIRALPVPPSSPPEDIHRRSSPLAGNPSDSPGARRARHYSAGDATTSELRVVRPIFRPVLQTHSSGSSSSAAPVRPKRTASQRRRSSGAGPSMISPGISREELDTPAGLKRGLRRARDLVQRELGGGSWIETGDEGAALMARLKDGTALCRLILQLNASDPPFPVTDIDESGACDAVESNIALFSTAASTLYRLPPSSLFFASDLLEPDADLDSLKRIVHTLTAIDDRSASTGSTLQRPSPTPLPLDINLRGRLVRARSTNAGTNGGGGGSSAGHADSHEDAGSSFSSQSSRQSSRMTDYSFAAPARKSVDVPSVNSALSTSGTPLSVTFVERIKASDREKEWGAPAGVVGSNKVYGNRFGSESAVNVMTVVEEDEMGVGGSACAPKPLRQSSSPRRAKRFSSDAIPLLRLDSPSKSADHVPEQASKPRRSMSSGANDVQRPVVLAQMLAAASRSSSSNSVDGGDAMTSVPFPSPRSLSPSTAHDSASPHRRPQQHKRWNSEIVIEQPMVRRDEAESPVRSRHESFQAPSPSLSPIRDGGKSGTRIARTKLVLREEGRPTLTYQLGECIGKGQFGSVYRALNLNSGRVVAVKRIQLDGKTDAEVQQLSNEIALLKSVQHPSIVRYEGAVQTEHFLNIVLEYVENGSLERTLRAFGELPEALCANYVVRILEALDVLHSKNIVHCDLKAANILTNKRGDIKLGDFGVSLNLTALRSENPEVNGTPYWMAPEVIQLQGANTASDVWSLGCTIIELIDGKPPYADLNTMSCMFRIVEDEHPPIPARCSPLLVSFLRQCFHKDPAARPTAQELFSHPWLSSAWDPAKDHRPQDSLPFLRRISTDLRRPNLESLASPSPLSSPPASPRLPFAIGQQRDSLDSTREREQSSSFGRQSAGAPRAHQFVKTTFSKPIECRLCGDGTKRHAVICQDCSLICHAHCAQYAQSCDFRAQLLGGARSPLAMSVSMPSSPVLSPSSASVFSLGGYLPFGRSRKMHKTSTQPPISPARRSGLSDSSPNSTPPRSLSRSHHEAMRRDHNSSDGSTAPVMSAGPLNHEASRSRVSFDHAQIGTQAHTSALARKLSVVSKHKHSHGRSVSQPSNHRSNKSVSEDCLLQ